jgi:hypothetical protein
MMNSSPSIEECTQKARIHFKNNDYRIVPHGEMRSILGLSKEQTNAVIERLQAEQFIFVIGDRLGERQYRTNKQYVPTAGATSLPESPMSINVIKDDFRPEEPKLTRNQLLVSEAFQKLKEIYPEGLTVEEIHEAIGENGSYEVVRAALKEAREVHHLVRSDKARSEKNNGRGYIVKHFWIGDDETFPIAKKRPYKTQKQHRSPTFHAYMIPSNPVAAEMQDLPNTPKSAEELLAMAIQQSPEKQTYLNSIRERVSEIQTILQNVETLRQELRSLEHVLDLHNNS